LRNIRDDDASEALRRRDQAKAAQLLRRWAIRMSIPILSERISTFQTALLSGAVPGVEINPGFRARYGTSTMKTPLLVSVVDDDESVRESLPDLLKEFGFTARAFSSAEEFLASEQVSQTSCLVLDVAMPRMSGPQLQSELKRLRIKIPIIFISARQDEAVRARVLEDGAVQYLLKPFSDTSLLEALNAALPER
jgi:CheY-like chemotaxis protein